MKDKKPKAHAPTRLQLFLPEDTAKMLMARTHWFIFFGPRHGDYIDKLDAKLGHYPTWPTVMAPHEGRMFSFTVIPKTELPREELISAMIAIGAPPEAVDGATADQDILVIADEIPDFISIMDFTRFLKKLAEDTP